MSETLDPRITDIQTPREGAIRNSEIALQQRFNMKFRNAVGRDVEMVLDEQIRTGLSQMRQEIFSRIYELNLHELDSSIADPIIDEIIGTRVKLFFTRYSWLEERAATQELKKDYIEAQAQNKDLQERVRRQMYDGMTGLFMRTFFMSEFNDMLIRVQRECFARPVALTVIMLDIDHFKKINDTYGHLVGDEVIKKVGSIIDTVCGRKTDLKGRYGGEEFAIVLHDCNESNAAVIGEKLRTAFEQSEIKVTNGGTKTVKFTASLGVYSVVFHKNPFENTKQAMSQLLECADKNLYISKNGGRNKATVTSENIGEMPDEDGALI